MDMTLYTGDMGDSQRINVVWSDENNVHRTTIIDIEIRNQDKPRTLDIIVNGVVVATTNSRRR